MTFWTKFVEIRYEGILRTLTTVPKKRGWKMEKMWELPAIFVLSNFEPKGFATSFTFEGPEHWAAINSLLAKGQTLTHEDDAKKIRSRLAIFPFRRPINLPTKELTADDKMKSVAADFGGLGMECAVHSCKITKQKELKMVLYGVRKICLISVMRQIPRPLIVRVAEVNDIGASSREIAGLRREIEALIQKLVASGDIKLKQADRITRLDNISAFADSAIFILRNYLEEQFTGDVLRGLFKELNVVLRLKFIRDNLQAKNVIRRGSLLMQRKEIEEKLKKVDPMFVSDSEFDEEFNERIFKAGMPPEIEMVARKELRRLKGMDKRSAEETVLRTHLEWLCDLPWRARSDDIFEPYRARQILDQDHYGLDKVKKRIIEDIAVRKLNKDKRGPILCLVGPPGVGKTSIGKSIARVINRQFVHISLGGVRDEVEIRGHRRTYVGALPGRILQQMKKAGTVNPVFMIDEIDKMSRDFKGDPSAALLEALDSEHNYEFSDHYLEVPYDLSQVLFICTANSLDPVPPALLDRMEVLRLPGYTRQEKLEIVKKFLVPKQLAEHGVGPQDISFTDGILNTIIEQYTREAGVRNGEREIANIIRNRAVLAAEGKTFKPRIEERDVLDILGPPKFTRTERAEFSTPGNVAFLARTENGGKIIVVETRKIRNFNSDEDAPQFICTGRLGEIMKESVRIAFACALNCLTRQGKDLGDIEKVCFHIHCAEAALPKEGTSAGLAFALSIISILTERTARSDVAVAGEISLRSGGLILSVSGIKERLLVAHRAGYSAVIIPEKNKNDLSDIHEDVKSGLDIRLVKTLAEAEEIAFEK